jgi:hypothetical protein
MSTIIEVITQQPLTTVEINSFVSVPSGGLDGQVLTKASNSNYDLEWTNVAGSQTDLAVANRTSTSFDITSSTGVDATLPLATTLLAGLLSSADKVKVDGIVAQVNADWNSVSGLSQILNKPSTFTPSAHSHVISDVTGLQTALDSKYNNPTGDTTQYIAGDGSLIAFPIAGQAGTLVRQVRNETGSTLSKGDVVYISGANGNKALVSKAIATSDATSAQTFGVVQADISTNHNGYVVVCGDLAGLDTSLYVDGTQLYLSGSVAGTVTSTKPVAPLHMVYVGIVTRQHATQGQIEVAIQNGYEMDELHDVLIVSKTNNDVISYDNVSGLWKNKQLTPADVSGLDTVLSNKQPSDATLTALAAYNTTGFVVQTASDTFTGRSLSAPASGITISNPAGTAGNPTFALANDLAAVEGLATNGIAVRTGTDTWNTRTVTAANSKVVITNGDGVSGNPTIGVAEANFTGIPQSAVTNLTTDLSNKQPLATVLTNTTASFTTALETKLNGIATGATANSSDATLLARANHTGTQLSSTISDLTETVQDIVGAQLVAGTNVTLNYNDTTGFLTINVSGITRTIVTTSGAATLPSDASTDYTVFIVGAHNQTMPTAVGNTNKYDIKNNYSANVTILTTSSQTIDGTTTISLSPQSAVTLISNGSNWSIF